MGVRGVPPLYLGIEIRSAHGPPGPVHQLRSEGIHTARHVARWEACLLEFIFEDRFVRSKPSTATYEALWFSRGCR